MSRVALWLSNFTSGEFSPRLEGRVDIKKYANSCRTLQNMIVHVHGGASRRFGTYYAGEIKSSASTQTRLIPFKYSNLYAYMMEFGDKYIRFYTTTGSHTTGTIPYEIPSPYRSNHLSAIKYVQSGTSLYLVHEQYPPQELKINSTWNWGIASLVTTAPPASWTTGTYPTAAAFYEQRLFFGRNQDIWASVSQLPDDFTTGTDDSDGFNYVMGYDMEDIRWMVPARWLMIGTTGSEAIMSSGSEDIAMTPSKAKLRQDTNKGSYDLQGLKVGSAILYLQRAGRKIRQFAYEYTKDIFMSDDVSILAEHITEGGISDWTYQPEPDSIIWAKRNDGKVIGLTYDQSQDVLAYHLHNFGGTVESIGVIPASTYDQLWLLVKYSIGGADKRYILYMKPDFVADSSDAFFVDCGLTYDDYATVTKATQTSPTVITCGKPHGWSTGYSIYIDEMANDSTTELNGNYYTIQDARPAETTITIAANGAVMSTYSSATAQGKVHRVVTSVSGLDHLEGKSVSVLGDGAVQASRTVTAGAITLSYKARKIHAGLPFTSILEPSRPEGGSLDGTSQGKRKRIHDIVIRFYRTIGANIGSNAGHIGSIPFRTPSDPMGSGPALFTGDKIVPFEGGWDTNGYIRITQEQPLPMTVLAISPRMNTE